MADISNVGPVGVRAEWVELPFDKAKYRACNGTQGRLNSIYLLSHLATSYMVWLYTYVYVETKHPLGIELNFHSAIFNTKTGSHSVR